MIFKFSTMFIVETENLNDDLKILKIIRNIFNTYDQMVLLTSVRPRAGFGPFDHRATISLSWYF